MRDLAVGPQAQRALLRLLVKCGLIETKDVEVFPDTESCPINFFSRRGKFAESAALKLVSENLKVPQFSLDKSNLGTVIATIESPMFERYDLNRWRSIRAIPVEVGETWVTLAMANPLDHEIKSTLEFELGRSVRLALASEEQILSVLAHKFNASALGDVNSLSPTESEEDKPELTNIQNQESSVFQGDASSAPIVRLVNKIFSDAVERGASDVHLTPEKEKIAVRVRVDGIMQPLFDIPSQAHASVLARIKLLCGMDIAERRKPQDGRLRIKTALGLRDLRVSVLPTVHGENVVARILSSDLALSSFGSLGMSQEMERRLQRVLGGSSRVVLVTGPTGSGKTSSLYAALLHLHDGKNNIITIEDPIEYRIQGINQIQVNPKIGMNFAETLRSVLRQDPDVVMVGEIRDKETAAIAMQVAQTGHLVLSTLHTNTAPAAITRLRDLGVPSYLIASSLGSILAQRLVRRLCTCAEPMKDDWAKRCGDLGLAPTALKQPKGCAECAQTGFQGRVGVFSFLEVNEEIIEAIRNDTGEAEIARIAGKYGYLPLEEAGLKLVEQGLTSLDELERGVGVVDPESLHSHSKLSVPKGPAAVASTGIVRRKVLLVEDEENTRVVLSMLLQREHFEVIEAANGAEALEFVYQHAPEIIISDLMMPKMSGFEFVKRLKNDSRTRSIPVLVLTAADDEKNELNLIGSGADDFVSKTSDSKIMVARVHRLLERAGSAK